MSFFFISLLKDIESAIALVSFSQVRYTKIHQDTTGTFGNMLGYLSVDSICSISQERSSRKTVSLEEQVMSKDRYPAYSRAKWKLLCLSLKYFSQHMQFRKLATVTLIFLEEYLVT